MKELQLRVRPYTVRKYIIEYRKINTGIWSRFNFFIPWKELTRVYHLGMLSTYPLRNHPVFYDEFDTAVRDAEGYKENPESLEEFIKSQDAEYSRLYLECEEYQGQRRRSKII